MDLYEFERLGAALVDMHDRRRGSGAKGGGGLGRDFFREEMGWSEKNVIKQKKPKYQIWTLTTRIYLKIYFVP